MSLYSIELKLAGRKCVVIGGGEVAERKVAALLDCDAEVTVISPELTEDLSALAHGGKIRHVPRRFGVGDLAETAVCIAATDDADANELAYREATRRNIPVNVVDQPELCSFFVPATVKRGPVSIAISTGGASPALARRLREQVEEVITEAHGELAEAMGRLREEVKERFPNNVDRWRIYRRMIESNALDLFAEGERDEAEDVLRACMS